MVGGRGSCAPPLLRHRRTGWSLAATPSTGDQQTEVEELSAQSTGLSDGSKRAGWGSARAGAKAM